MRTIPEMSRHLQILDNFITTDLIPAITGGIQATQKERKLFALPPSMGGLGIPIFVDLSEIEHANSIEITKSLQGNIIKQVHQYDVDKIETTKTKSEIKRLKKK